MIYYKSFSTDPYINLASEYYLAKNKKTDEMILLLWQTRPTLMVGNYQNIYEEIDIKKASDAGISIVRRKSGGGTIYTDEGSLIFSFIDANASRQINFDKYIDIIKNPISKMGLVVEKVSRNDLYIGGKKFSGNAQYRVGATTIHHGSILYSTDLEKLSTYIKTNKHIKSSSIKSRQANVTNLAFYLKYKSLTAFKNELIDNLADETLEFSKTDIEHIKNIGQTFKKLAYIYKNDIDFTIKNFKKFSAGILEVRASIENGFINNISFRGDYFTLADVSYLENKLRGEEFRYSNTKVILDDFFNKYPIYGISSADIIDLLFKGE